MDRRSFAWPLALWYVALVVYASLYPFAGWRSQAVSPFDYLWAPWPRYWTMQDVLANVVGYIPLGFLVTWAVWRSGYARWALAAGFFMASALSLSMEALQNFLPFRVPSNVDWLLNSGGGLLGSLAALALGWLGMIARWGRFREDWFVPQSRGALVLLALWPAAAIYPASVPYGLGQVWQRLEAAMGGWLSDTPFVAWVPLASPNALQLIGSGSPLSPLAVALCVALSLLTPCLLGYCVIHTLRQRAWYWLVCCLGAAAVGGLSAGLTYGAAHAWDWLSPEVLVGAAVAAGTGLLCLGLRRRTCAVLMLLALAFSLGLLNRAPESPYFAESLALWQRGRYTHFHGLSQWLGWVWPYLALVYGVWLASRRSP